jgi:hypothetical protein
MTRLNANLNTSGAAIYLFFKFPTRPVSSSQTKNPPGNTAGCKVDASKALSRRRGLFLPRALLMPIGLKALAALVLRHFQTTFLFQIAHGVRDW